MSHVARDECGALLVDAADFTRALVHAEIRDRGERNRDGPAGVDDEPAQLLEPEPIFLTEPHDDVDQLILLAELRGGAALNLVPHEIGDGAEGEAVFGEPIAIVDHLDLRVAGLKARADVDEAGHRRHQDGLRFTTELLQCHEIVPADLDLDGALEAEERRVRDFDFDLGQILKFRTDAIDQDDFVLRRQAGLQLDREPRSVFAGFNRHARALFGADRRRRALDFGLFAHDGVDLFRHVRGSLERRADGQSDVEVELALVNLRDEVAAETRHHEKRGDDQRGDGATEHHEAVSQRRREHARIVVLHPCVAAFEPCEARARHRRYHQRDRAHQADQQLRHRENRRLHDRADESQRQLDEEARDEKRERNRCREE
jgi:hypothetical protein